MPDPVIIVNPTAGRGQAGKQARAVAQTLRQHGILRPVWLHTKARGDAERFAKDAAANGAALVVAMGGDGTLHEVMNGIWGTTAVLGLIPFGTGNDFARALGVFGNLERACAALGEKGETRKVDVGVIDGSGTNGPRRFLVLAGTGFDARTAQTVNAGIRGLSGAPAYLWGAVLTLKDFAPFQLTLTTDGQTRRADAMFVSVANTPTTGGGMKIAPEAAIDDGLLDLCVVGAMPRLSLLRAMPQVLKGTHIHNPAVTMLRAATVELNADPPQPLLIDGEVLGTTPATVTILPRALPVRAPRDAP